MVAVIPAAGLGKRMAELTKDLPKPMLKVWGKPILEHIIMQMRKGGIDTIILIVGYKKQKIMDYFGNGSRFGVNIVYAIQDKPRGQTEALLRAAPYLDTDMFFVQMADILVPWWWYGTLKLYVTNNITGGVITVNANGDYRAGAGVILDENNNVLDVVEKPQDPEQKFEWNNSGIMLLNRRIISYLPKDFNDTQEIYIAEIIQNMLRAGEAFRGYPIEAHYYDFKNREAFEHYRNRRTPLFLR